MADQLFEAMDVDEVVPAMDADHAIPHSPLRTSPSDELIDLSTDKYKEQFYPIWKCLTCNVGATDMMTLRRTCKALEPIYRELQKFQWNIDSKLERFFKDPKGFCSILSESKATVSGSFALQFFGKFSIFPCLGFKLWQLVSLQIAKCEFLTSHWNSPDSLERK